MIIENPEFNRIIEAAIIHYPSLEKTLAEALDSESNFRDEVTQDIANVKFIRNRLRDLIEDAVLLDTKLSNLLDAGEV